MEPLETGRGSLTRATHLGNHQTGWFQLFSDRICSSHLDAGQLDKDSRIQFWGNGPHKKGRFMPNDIAIMRIMFGREHD
jgi:hypothetical protein